MWMLHEPSNVSAITAVIAPDKTITEPTFSSSGELQKWDWIIQIIGEIVKNVLKLDCDISNLSSPYLRSHV